MKKLLNLVAALAFICAVQKVTPAETEFPEAYEIFNIDNVNWLDQCLKPNKSMSMSRWCIIELEDATFKEYRWGKGPLLLFRKYK